MNKKQRLWKKLKSTNDSKVREEYNRVRNQVRMLTRKKVKIKEKNIAKNAKENPKRFWSYVQKKSKTKSSVPDLYKNNLKNELTKGEKEKADTLADFFGSVFTKEIDGNLPEIKMKERIEELNECVFSVEDVEKKLVNLKTSKSP